MTKKIKKNIGGIIAGLVLVGGAAGVAWADVEGIPFTIRTGGSTNTPCPGAYSGYAKMTNGSALWFTPPTNASSGTSRTPRVLARPMFRSHAWCAEMI